MKVLSLCFTLAVLCVSSSLVYANPYDRGYEAGHQDAMDGAKSLCAPQRCRAADDYERGYKLGYRNGTRERKQDPSAVYPLIDSPGKTIGSDFNGDGIYDVIVGAYSNDDAGDLAGAAYILFGSSTVSGTKYLGVGGAVSVDVTIVGKATSDRFGRAVASAGDVNGDGFDDIIMGARFNNDGGTDDEGAAYIFFGASNLSGTKRLGGGASADVTILGKAANDYLSSYGVSGVGDVNGDGFDDFIVGAHGNDDAVSNAGAAYIFFGAGDLSGTYDMGGGVKSADVTIFGKINNDQLGFSSSGAGDVNGDGFDDIMVGARLNDDGASNGGAAYVFFGARNLSGTKRLGGGESADVTILAKAANDRLGTAVSGAGDVNGDGFDDFIIGAYYSNEGGTNDEGAAYIFFGASNLSGTFDMGGGVKFADVTVLGKAVDDYLGRAVASAGDVNGDGFNDIVVGAPQNNDGGTSDEGAAYIFFGANNLSGTKDLGGGASADMTILGTGVSAKLGTAASGAGDINGDGFPDIIVGAISATNQASEVGAAYVFFGASNLSGTKNTSNSDENVRILGKTAYDTLGGSVGGGRSNPGP